MRFTFAGGASYAVRELSPQLLAKAWRLAVRRRLGASNPRLRRQGAADIKALALEWKRRVAFTPEKHDVVSWRGRRWRVVRVWTRSIRLVPVSHVSPLGIVQVTCFAPVASGGFIGARLVSSNSKETPWWDHPWSL